MKNTNHSKRNQIIALAREKYILSGRTKNISVAMHLYLTDSKKTTGLNKSEVIPEVITRKTKPQNWADMLKRPKCPKCDFSLKLRVINAPRGKANIHGWKTCWECLKCGYEKYNAETVKELISKELSVNAGGESG